MKLQNYIITAIILLTGLPALGQTTQQEMTDNINKTAGVYYAYPISDLQPQTKVPNLSISAIMDVMAQDT